MPVAIWAATEVVANTNIVPSKTPVLMLRIVAPLGWPVMTAETSRLQSAGVNRHEAEEEESLRERSSEPLGPEFCSGHREVLAEA